MFNSKEINKLLEIINNNQNINSKEDLIKIIVNNFNLEKDRSLYYNSSFALRISQSKNNNAGNTILCLKKLIKYNNIPMFSIMVSPHKVEILLCNLSFIKRVSHSSKKLAIDNLIGSINYSDIERNYFGLINDKNNFEKLFNIHYNLSVDKEIKRLVESTQNIIGYKKAFVVNNEIKNKIIKSIDINKSFINSDEFHEIEKILNNRVNREKERIKYVANNKNVNLRGREIEFLITEDDENKKKHIFNNIIKNQGNSDLYTDDDLGDYSIIINGYDIKVDIKSKLTYSTGSPKGVNIDKLLEHLSNDKSIYLIFVVAIDEDGNITTRLISIFDDAVIDNKYYREHWSGRNMRGTVQFSPNALISVIDNNYKMNIDYNKSVCFIEELINQKSEC